MIERLRGLFKGLVGESGAGEAGADDETVRVAVATLLVEMARADFVQDESERRVLAELLGSHFELEKHQAEELLGLADARADAAVSLQEFTREIHETLGIKEKLRILEMLLKVALADGRLDKHERHLLGKVADLLYVPRADYVTLKDAVLRAYGK